MLPKQSLANNQIKNSAAILNEEKKFPNINKSNGWCQELMCLVPVPLRINWLLIKVQSLLSKKKILIILIK